MEMPQAQKPVDKRVYDTQDSDKNRIIELTFDEAQKAYDAGQELRERVMQIAQDDDYCYDIFNDVHGVFFKGMNAEDISRHIMHRILMGTMISEKEVRTLILDQTDMDVYEKFLVPASCARSKEELGEVMKELLGRYDLSYVVQ